MPAIGGLAITDSALRFAVFTGEKKVFTSSLGLPPGILENGRIKDRANFIAALKKLHGEIGPVKKPIHAILDLPHETVYVQSFSVPYLTEGRLEETAKLNLQMISPIDFKLVYSSWQKIGEAFVEGAQLELLGAFVEAKIVDDFTSAMKEANFTVSAVEFPALSLVRIINHETDVKTSESCLVAEVSNEGLALMIVKNANLYFNHFHSWRIIGEEVGEKTISKSGFKNYLNREVQKVLNFYSSRWGGSIVKAIIAAPSMAEEITPVLEENFQLTVTNFPNAKNFPNLTGLWFPVLGSALRGFMSREEDVDISLTTAPVKTQYWQARLDNFANLWKKIVFTVLVFVTFLYGVMAVVLIKEEKALKAQPTPPISKKDLEEMRVLENKAKEFNRVVNLIVKARVNASNWSVFLNKIKELAGSGIRFKNMRLERLEVSMVGSANSETAVLLFKEKLLKEQSFRDVSLPLSEVKSNPDGTVDFSVSFRIEGSSS